MRKIVVCLTFLLLVGCGQSPYPFEKGPAKRVLCSGEVYRDVVITKVGLIDD
jgi:hypothetical protein